MDKHDATETAYRNGYADGFADAKKHYQPVQMGDLVWGLRHYCDQRLLKCGRVSAISYNEEMQLCVTLKNACKGVWGREIFATQEEALEALGRVKRPKA